MQSKKSLVALKKARKTLKLKMQAKESDDESDDDEEVRDLEKLQSLIKVCVMLNKNILFASGVKNSAKIPQESFDFTVLHK